MIPGTPLISTRKTGDIIYQILVIFDRYEGDKPNLAWVYNPQTNDLEQGNIDGLMQLNGQAYDPNNVVIIKWEDTILDYVRVTESYYVLFRPNPELPHFSHAQNIIAHHINRAVDQYRYHYGSKADRIYTENT